MTKQLVTAVFEPSDRAGAGRAELDSLVERITASGVIKPEARLDERTGAVHVTFTTVAEPAPVIERLHEELAGQWTLLGRASYAIAEFGDPPQTGWRWPARALATIALCLCICVLAGFAPYDFDDRLIGYFIGAAILVAPLAAAAYLVVTEIGDRVASKSGYDIR